MVGALYGYDNAGPLTSLNYSTPISTLADYAFGYNRYNQITSFSNSQHSEEDLTYGYDSAGQLTSVTNSTDSSADESYSYDSNGNRNSTGYTTDTNNKLASDGTYDYTYDANGNLIQETDITTGSTAGNYTTYAYDNRNRLTTATSYNSDHELTQTVAYVYDALDRRIVESVTIGDTTNTTKFVYDGQNIVATLDGGNNLTNRYLDGPHGGSDLRRRAVHSQRHRCVTGRRRGLFFTHWSITREPCETSSSIMQGL